MTLRGLPMTEPDSEELLDALPDNPCGQEAHQQVLGESESVEQARATSYMAGFFDAEGCIHSNPSVRDDRPIGAELRNHLSVQLSVAQMAGLFDGEGCISYNVLANEAASHDFASVPQVTMQQNQKKTMLEQIFEAYCSRHDVDYKTYYIEERGNHSPAVRAQVNKSDNIRDFLSPLLPVLCEKRRQAVIMLREILPRYENKVHLTKQGFIKMMRWKRELDREKPKGDEDRKYTVEYFEDLWEDDLDAQQQLSDFQTEEPERVRLSDD
jgi:hypothetical protein